MEFLNFPDNGLDGEVFYVLTNADDNYLFEFKPLSIYLLKVVSTTEGRDILWEGQLLPVGNVGALKVTTLWTTDMADMTESLAEAAGFEEKTYGESWDGSPITASAKTMLAISWDEVFPEAPANENPMIIIIEGKLIRRSIQKAPVADAMLRELLYLHAKSGECNGPQCQICGADESSLVNEFRGFYAR